MILMPCNLSGVVPNTGIEAGLFFSDDRIVEYSLLGHDDNVKILSWNFIVNTYRGIVSRRRGERDCPKKSSASR